LEADTFPVCAAKHFQGSLMSVGGAVVSREPSQTNTYLTKSKTKLTCRSKSFFYELGNPGVRVANAWLGTEAFYMKVLPSEDHSSVLAVQLRKHQKPGITCVSIHVDMQVRTQDADPFLLKAWLLLKVIKASTCPE